MITLLNCVQFTLVFRIKLLSYNQLLENKLRRAGERPAFLLINFLKTVAKKTLSVYNKIRKVMQAFASQIR